MSTPVYDPSVPEFPSDGLATSQPEILSNFQTLYNVFLKNHIPLDDPTVPGNHTIIELLEQKNSQQTDLGEISIYSKLVEGQTDQLFIRFQGNSNEVQLTNYQIYSLNQPTGQTAFFTFLPGKLLLYFGSFTASGGTRPTPFVLSLLPAVAINIVSIDTCAIGTATYKPCVTVQAAQNGFYKFINFNPSAAGAMFNKFYYAILANI
jgi:hypothetical protein